MIHVHGGIKGGMRMNDSILTSIKKLLGITEEYEHFDQDIIIHINSVFMILNLLFVVSSNSFSITDKSAVWSDFISEGTNLESVKSYIYLKVRLLCDPPTTSAVMESMNRMISELEFRLNVSAESS